MLLMMVVPQSGPMVLTWKLSVEMPRASATWVAVAAA